MKNYDIEDLLLGASYEGTYTWDYAGHKDRYTGEVTGGHKKGDKYTVELDTWDVWSEEGDPVQVPGLGLVSHVEQFGGEGQGDMLWFVLKIDPEDGEDTFFVRKSGYYASFDGGYYDGNLEIVEPREKTVTVYEAV